MLPVLTRYLSAAIGARLADEGARVSIVLLAIEETGHAATGGLLVAALMVPHVAAAPLAGAAADRARRRKQLYLAAFVAYAISLTGAALLVGPATWAAAVLLFAGGCLAPLLFGGLTSLLRELVPGNLGRAFGYDATTYSMAGIAGPALAAVVAGYAGAAWSLVTLAGFALVGAAAFGTLPINPSAVRATPAVKPPAASPGTARHSWLDPIAAPIRNLLLGVLPALARRLRRTALAVVTRRPLSTASAVARSCRSGWSVVVARSCRSGGSVVVARPSRSGGSAVARSCRSGWSAFARSCRYGGSAVVARSSRAGAFAVMVRRPRLGAVTATTGISQFGFGALPLAAAAIATARHDPPLTGVIMAVSAAGSLVGSLLSTRIPIVHRRPERILLICTAMMAAGFLPVAFLPGAWPVIALAGLLMGPVTVALFSVRDRESPPEMRTQVFTLGAGIKVTSAAAGAAVGGLMSGAGPGPLLMVIAAGQLLAAVTGALILRRAGQHAEAASSAMPSQQPVTEG